MIPERLRSVLTDEVIDLAALFQDAGRELYLVGGSVRDALLGREISDLDFATDARPQQIEQIAEPWAHSVYVAGKAFGTIGLVRDHQTYEVTTLRSDVYRDDSRKPMVTFSDDIVEDLSRRDFTVNAMALKVPTSRDSVPEMIDPFSGLVDLGAKVLRTPVDGHVSFGDDPLRMLRLFRFMSTIGFVPDDRAMEAVVEMKERLSIISAERIRTEFDKLIVGDDVVVALDALVRAGLAAEFIPEVPALGVEQDPVHRHKDVLAHTIAVVGKTSPRLRLRLAALFHDIGKPATREFGKAGVSFHHHEVVGARMTRTRMKDLRYPNDLIEDVSRLVFLHMRPHTYKMGWTDAAVRRYVRDAGPLVAELNELVRCDVTTRNERRARTISNRIDELEIRIAELRQKEELDRLRPPIDGNDVMAYLGIPPSRKVGTIMKMLLEHRIEDGPYSPEDAYRMLDEWQGRST
ncbi:MAG: CCA tRNA nucleotidyltransferase [Acidimicrobiia bacterium]|nr:MAG: CCA tRNA nucleotidyltransferase [Acidimicrobiia bacterium]